MRRITSHLWRRLSGGPAVPEAAPSPAGSDAHRGVTREEILRVFAHELGSGDDPV